MHSIINAPLFGTSPDGFIPALAITNYLQNAHKILIIGDFTKRDYTLLKALNKDVYLLDIVAIEGVEQFYQQSITELTPFEDNFFDGIIMAEVIEHLFEDQKALQEIERILKPTGTLIITVPYFSNKQDEPEYHVRIHSIKTIARLLESTGFKIQKHFYRGLISRLPQIKFFKPFIFGISKVLRTLFGHQKGLFLFQKICFSLEHFLGTHRLSLSIQKKCVSFGGIMAATKTSKTDFLAIQKKSFTLQKQI